ncbi:ATP-binding protein [Comamonadaceae bacterium PP-2]
MLRSLLARWPLRRGRRPRTAPESGPAPTGTKAADRPYSLRRRLIVTTVGSSVVCWLVSLAIIVGTAWQETSDVFDDTLEEAARLVAVLSASMQQRGELTGDGDLVGRAGRQRVRLYYQVVGERGEVLRRSSQAPRRPYVERIDTDRDFYNVWSDGRTWRVHVLHVPDAGFYVQIAQPWDTRTELLEEMGERLVWPALGLLALLGLLNWLAIRQLLRPLERMAGDIGRKSPGDLSPVSHRGQADELRPMVDALNGVLQRLSEALSTERRFTADAAHELRTPLAALRMKIQLMQRTQTAQPGGVDTGASLKALRDDVDRCTALVENLLALARLDPQQPGSLPLKPTDVHAWVNAAVADCAPAAQAKAVSLTVDVQVDTLPMHQELMRSALRNLIDNAVRYGHAGGRVRVEVGLAARTERRHLPGLRPAAQRRACVVVLDDGPGVSEQDRARLTQRFFRALGTHETGSGLGLSIVERIAALHGGEVRLATGLEGRGLSVTIEWPCENT